MVKQDLLGMWIAGNYNELFAALRQMSFGERVREVKELCHAMADFDECNSDEDPADELPRFLDECIARLA